MLAEAYDRLEPLTARMVVPSVSMARLLAAGRPGRSGTVVGIPLAGDRGAAAACRGRGPRDRRTREIRRHYLILAQLAALVARYDRDAAETIFAPVAENARALIDDRFDLSNEAAAILQAAAALRPPRGPGHGRRLARRPRAEARDRAGQAHAHHATHQADGPARGRPALALPPGARRREALRVPGQFDLWPAVLDD